MHFDSHIHLDVVSPDLRIDPVSGAPGYRAFVPGITAAGVRAALEMDLPGAVYGAAIHPWYANAETPTTDPSWDALVQLSADPRIVGLGETGLDHYRFREDESRQRAAAYMRAHAKLAVDVGKPLALHCVRAHADCMEILRDTGAAAVGGIVHAFAGSPEEARAYAALHFRVGIGPAVTRKRSKRVRRAASTVPLEQLVIETDAPYMTVGERGSGQGVPGDIALVAATIAELRGMSVDDLLQQTWANAEAVFSQTKP